MRHLPVIVAALVLTACSAAPVQRGASQATGPTQTASPELQNESIDSGLS
jgi:outer membrane PBP1 activator LpoA protein